MVDYLMPENDTFVLKSADDDSGDLRRIAAGGSVSREMEIGDPEVMVKGGRKYGVKAKGKWMAVWVGESEDGKYKMGDALVHGRFESEVVEVET